MVNLTWYLDYLNENPMTMYLLVGLVSVFVGSFLNVVISRLPMIMHGENHDEINNYMEEMGYDTRVPDYKSKLPRTIWGRSQCPHCKETIPFWHNIPIVSYLFLKGKCFNCKEGISFRYFLMEFLTPVMSLAIVYYNGLSTISLLGVVLTWMLIAAVMIDLDETILPDSITQPMLWITLLFTVLFDDPRLDTVNAVVGAVAGYMTLWTIYWGFKLLTGKEGMGYGDFKLLAALGAVVGVLYIPYLLILSVGIGIITAFFVKIKHNGDNAIPYGPALAIAGWLIFMHQSGMNIPLLP